MKYLILIVIFGLFSCKSEDGKLDDLQQNELETVLTENVTEIDTTSFMEFFEKVVFQKPFLENFFLKNLLKILKN